MIPRRIRSKVFTRQTYISLFLGFLVYCTVRTLSVEIGQEDEHLLTKEELQDVNVVRKVAPQNRISGDVIAPMTQREIPKPQQKSISPIIKRLHKSITPKNSANISHNCSSWFGQTFDDNLDVIRNYPKGIVDQYMAKLGGNLSLPQQMLTSFPVIVTAANAGFFGVTQGLLKTIHEKLIPKYGDIKIIYYDMGLQEKQLKQLKAYCKCEVRRFPFEEFPGHVKMLKTYAWKPIIVQKLLMEYGWVWWMDSSVRFVTDQLDAALDYSRENSFLFFTYGDVFAVAQHTDVQTMEYLGEDRCKFRYFGEIEATFVLFHFDDVTQTLVNAWAACALNSDCMAPPGTAGKLGCNVFKKQDGRCHRFDQAVLSVLFRRLYHDQNDYPLVDVPFHIHDIRRGNAINYFPKV